MSLTKAEFSGFGRLADAHVDLDHKVVAIVGPNEAAKSTLLRTVAYIDNGESRAAVQPSCGLPGEIADDYIVVRVQCRIGKDGQRTDGRV
ncbi:MAG TPA: AAA family ATPase [Nitriliruptorales bacterium]